MVHFAWWPFRSFLYSLNFLLQLKWHKKITIATEIIFFVCFTINRKRNWSEISRLKLNYNCITSIYADLIWIHKAHSIYTMSWIHKAHSIFTMSLWNTGNNFKKRQIARSRTRIMQKKYHKWQNNSLETDYFLGFFSS